MVYSAQRDVTHQQNLNGSFSPVNMKTEGPEGGGSAQGGSQDIAGIKMTVGLLGCRCTRRARGGDLGNGGGPKDDPAICHGQ